MVYKWELAIPELTGARLRNAYVYLPESYEYNAGKRYPVLYMFDGHNVFFDEDATYGKCWGMKEYMDATQTQMIVAAVECNHSPDHGRLREYSPFDFTIPGYGEVTGQGQVTMKWLTDSFKPYIDANFRTLPERRHTFIAGSSMGGLMSIYALLSCNRIFSRAAALSPALTIAPDAVMQMIRQAKVRSGTHLYMDFGSREINAHKKMVKQYGQAVTLLTEKGIFLTSRIVPGGEHCEASWEKQIPYFMNTLLYQ